MKKVLCSLALLPLILVANVGAQAEGLDPNKIYAGGGLAFNSLPGVGSARGFQFFAGYDFDVKINDDISTALEIGFMDSGNFDRINTGGSLGDATGAWVTVVESVALTSKTDMLARLGYDFGDDDGLIFGAGLQYKFDTKVALRIEYVTREHVNGLQANVLFKF